MHHTSVYKIPNFVKIYSSVTSRIAKNLKLKCMIKMYVVNFWIKVSGVESSYFHPMNRLLCFVRLFLEHPVF